ncbi:MAG: hypothetical protein C4308_06105 [Chitinophagaceae bacterium]
MKKLLIIFLLIFGGLHSFAQDDDNERIRDKMKEFIQRRLNISRAEAGRFAPIFVRYFREWRTTLRETPDILLRQQRVAELRMRYREEFKPILGEHRSNQVFVQQDVFIHELINMQKENRMMKDRPGKRFRSTLQ